MGIGRALLSVSDKREIVDLASGLPALGVELVSTGGTAQILRDSGLVVRTVEDLTGFPEILGGRVKTLHPAIHGGVLARREAADLAELAAHGIGLIDLVVVNLYPFAQTVAQGEVGLAEAVEQIDIGGVALLRAAAKNHASVTVLCDPADYSAILLELSAHGSISEPARRRLALKAFRHTAAYDATIAGYLAGQFEPADTPGDDLLLSLWRVQSLRYGENPHQQAALYGWAPDSAPLGARLLQGQPLSYNNLLDLDAAWRAVSDFSTPTIVIIKHNTPCGVASAGTLTEAFTRALASDPVSAFGSVIATNRPFDRQAAEALGDLFVEAIAAPGFSEDALEHLGDRARCRLLEMGHATSDSQRWEMRSVRQGLLLQERDVGAAEDWRVVSARQPTPEEQRDLQFAWLVAKHVRSNAIVLARGQATVGIGAGQMSRVDAVRLAVLKAGQCAAGAVLASDAFFPFADGLEEAAQAGVTAVVQPGGSLRDSQVIAAADAEGMAMVFTGTRHFRH